MTTSMTTVATWPISRVSCWRRKLWRTFDDRDFEFQPRHIRRPEPKCNIWGREFQGGRENNSFNSNSFRDNFFAKF
jgi:hypothetical protein